MLTLAVTVALSWHHHDDGRSFASWLAAGAALVAGGLWALRTQGLWVERLIAVRSIEVARLARAVCWFFAAGLLIDRLLPAVHLHVSVIVAAVGISALLLLVWRAGCRAWLAAQRREGRYSRRVVVVGSDLRATQLAGVFVTHPEAGMDVVGMIGSRRELTIAGFGHLWIGNADRADRLLADWTADVVVLSPSDLNPALVDQIIRDEQLRGRDLYLDPGLSGIDSRRVLPVAISYTPLLHVNTSAFDRLPGAVKRAFDIAVASLMLLVASPVLLAIALAIWLEDRGPVLFRQTRVGRGDVEFQILKFRSMAVDAEARLAALVGANGRHGPLFKMDDDPRVTRVGRFLRTSSLDELPQLFNVLRGEMSLVGPRPALPSEVSEFPLELRARHRVRPGITGLWQVEARDNPAFEAYRRLDLFYVENWSLALDLVILLGTVDQLLLRRWLRRPVTVDDEGDKPYAVADVSGVSGVSRVSEPASVSDPTDPVPRVGITA